MNTKEDIMKALVTATGEEEMLLGIGEILLDIREHLGKLVMHQGVAKWGAKVGPSVVDTKPSPSEQIDRGIIFGQHDK